MATNSNERPLIEIFQDVLRKLCNECLAKGYEILLEADLAGWLFHLFLLEPEIHHNHLHMNARLKNAYGFCDIAIGPVETSGAVRPYTNPGLVIEMKLFPRLGFTNQQHYVHYLHILKDGLPKLGNQDLSCGYRAAVIMDGVRYLDGKYQGNNRKIFLVKKRNQIAPRTHLFLIRLIEGNWDIEYIKPFIT